MIIPIRFSSCKTFLIPAERTPILRIRETGTVRDVPQAGLEIFEMFEARQQRANKVSFVGYSVGNSRGIVGYPMLKGQLTLGR